MFLNISNFSECGMFITFIIPRFFRHNNVDIDNSLTFLLYKKNTAGSMIQNANMQTVAETIRMWEFS